MMSKICAFIFALLLLSSAPCFGQAQQYRGVAPAQKPKSEAPKEPFFQGASASFDVCGAVMAAFTPYGQFEGAVRANLKNAFFPIIEVGLGVSDHSNEESNLHYKVHSPYFRLGMDYNMLRKEHTGNRVFVGARYGFSFFKYDLSGPDIEDPVYGDIVPFSYSGLSGNAHWAEAVFGVEAKVWKFFHLGWTFRYKFRIHEKEAATGHAWYIPGYGKSDGHCLGGTFNIIFDI